MEDAKKRGVENRFEHSHEEIAKELGVSRAYVCAIEKAALEKVRRALRARYDVHTKEDIV